MDTPHVENPDHTPNIELTAPAKVVAAGHGVELYNLGTDKQTSYFTIYSPERKQWLTYRIPMLSGGRDGSQYLWADEMRDSCPIVCTPYLHEDGTIYIGGAGGVLNRLTPKNPREYTHSYLILDKEHLGGQQPLEFVESSMSAELIAMEDVSFKNITVARTSQGRTVYRSFFQSYNNRVVDLDSGRSQVFNMLLEQERLTQADLTKSWEKKKKTVLGVETSIQDGMEQLRLAFAQRESSESERQNFENILADMIRKDGPMKSESVKIWERNSEMFGKGNTEGVLEAAETLMPGLSEEWDGHLYTEDENKWKIYDERLPVYRVNVSEVPGNSDQLIVSVMGHVYRMSHSSGALNFIGAAPQEHSRRVDTRSLVVLDENTFIIGKMGAYEQINGPKTLRILVDKQGSLEYSEGHTTPVLEKTFGTVDNRSAAQYHSKNQKHGCQPGMQSPRLWCVCNTLYPHKTCRSGSGED